MADEEKQLQEGRSEEPSPQGADAVRLEPAERVPGTPIKIPSNARRGAPGFVGTSVLASLIVILASLLLAGVLATVAISARPDMLDAKAAIVTIISLMASALLMLGIADILLLLRGVRQDLWVTNRLLRLQIVQNAGKESESSSD
jgi:hypothetical protein